MSFFSFREECDSIIGDLPIWQLCVGAVLFLQIIPYSFTLYNPTPPKMISISKSWREPGSFLSVHFFLLYYLIVYVCMCSNSTSFRVVSIIAIILILCVFHVNPDAISDEKIKEIKNDISISEKERDIRVKQANFTNNLTYWHRRNATVLFVFLYVAAICVINYNIGWPFDNGMSIDKETIRIVIFFCFGLSSICIFSMVGIMVREKLREQNNTWTSLVSGLEHAFFDLFCIIAMASQRES